VIPGYFAIIFFIFAIAARRSVQQTCHHINATDCHSETTLNYVIIVMALIFITYILYWVRHSYKKDPRAFYYRGVELQSSLNNNNYDHRHGRHAHRSGHRNTSSMLPATSTSRSGDDDDDDGPHFPRTHTTADFGVTVNTHSGHGSGHAGNNGRTSTSKNNEQYITLNSNNDASLLGL
jgi:hypothetical protein